jgi:hypothetical protein
MPDSEKAVLVWNSFFARSSLAVAGDLSAILRRIVFIGEAALCLRFEFGDKARTLSAYVRAGQKKKAAEKAAFLVQQFPASGAGQATPPGAQSEEADAG